MIYILLSRLIHEFGIKRRVLEWFTSYLSKRSQFISVNGGRSRLYDVSCGVPQGSCLGPLLFVLYLVNCLALWKNTYQLLMYLLTTRNSMYRSSATLEHCIDDIKDWMLSDKFKG